MGALNHSIQLSRTLYGQELSWNGFEPQSLFISRLSSFEIFMQLRISRFIKWTNSANWLLAWIIIKYGNRKFITHVWFIELEFFNWTITVRANLFNSGVLFVCVCVVWSIWLVVHSALKWGPWTNNWVCLSDDSSKCFSRVAEFKNNN